MFNIKKLVVLLLCAGLVFQAHFGIAGPQGGKVVGGNANISQSGPNTTINQSSDRAIINWNSFDIGKNESVRHNMPSSNSAGLHRVVGKGGPSQIEGLLQSNGNIYLVNPAGVVIHNGAKIDVNGFVATSRDIANDNFMKGKMVFDKPGLPGAAIINQGNISLRDNGLAALVAPTVRNDGIIAGKLGKVALGGSDAAWKLDMTGDDLIAFTMDEKQVNTLYAADGTPLARVQNNGKIKAEGGTVILTASQLDGIVGSVVNNGEISAASAETKGGKIIFRGQGNKVDVVNNGQLDVSSKAAEGGNVRMTGQAAVTHVGKIDATGKTKGGNVVITGENVTLKSGSRIDASGTNGGGTVLVGGNARGKGPEANAKTTLVQSDAEILADAKLLGDGGQIVVWADEKTQFDGKATARGGENGGDGGMVETSAKLLIIGDPAVVNTSAKKGKAGEWLLDPEDFVIAEEGGDISGKTISDNLEINNVAIIVEDDGTEGNGNIIIKDKIEWNSDSTLSLTSLNNVILNSYIISSGNNSSLYINYVNGNFIINDGKVTLLGKDTNLYINDEKYNIIRSITELQNIKEFEYGSYALVNDIDASITNTWNEYQGEYKGFKPIYFRGNFDGLGHVISNLYINRQNEECVGLFASITDSEKNKRVANLLLKNVDITGYDKVGALSGRCTKNTTINNISSSGIVKGITYVGGLIGELKSINMYSNIVILLSSSSCDVYAGNKNYTRNTGTAGGLIGVMDAGKIIRCYASGNVEGKYVGGLLGWSDSGSIRDSYSISKVIGHAENGSGHAGGIQGGKSSGKMFNCFSAGKVTLEVKDGKEMRDCGGIMGTYSTGFENCYWNTETSGLDRGVGLSQIDEEQPSESILKGLTTEQMMQQASFEGWDFENVWKIDEGKSYPELRMVANNDLVLPDKPADPAPPIVNPDPDLNPEGPDTPDPKPDTPDTPDNPDVPVNPDPKPDTPVNPDKPVNPDPKPDTPITPEQPSNPGTNPGDTPSQPSTKPDTKPDNPGSNTKPNNPGTNTKPNNPTPEKPSQPTVPSTPVNPVKPTVPVSPDTPSNPSVKPGIGNHTGYGNSQGQQGPTTVYTKSNGNIYVYLDNQFVGIKNNSDGQKYQPIPTGVNDNREDNNNGYSQELQDAIEYNTQLNASSPERLIIAEVNKYLPQFRETRNFDDWHNDIHTLNYKYLLSKAATKGCGEIITQVIKAGVGMPVDIFKSLKNLITDKEIWKLLGKAILSDVLLSYAEYYSGQRYNEITHDSSMSNEEKTLRHLWCLYNSSIYHSLGMSIMQEERDNLEKISNKNFGLQVVYNTAEVTKSMLNSIVKPIVEDYTSGKSVIEAGNTTVMAAKNAERDWYTSLRPDLTNENLLALPGSGSADKFANTVAKFHKGTETFEKGFKDAKNIALFGINIQDYINNLYSEPAISNISSLIDKVSTVIPNSSLYNERPAFEQIAIDFNGYFK